MNKQSAAEQLIEEIISIREQYQAEVGSKRKPWPKSIKTRIRDLDRLGISMQKISNSVKIPYQTIMYWRFASRKALEAKKGFHAIAVNNPTVTVGEKLIYIPKAKAQKIPRLDPTVTVRTPDGYVLEIPSSKAVQFLFEIRNRK